MKIKFTATNQHTLTIKDKPVPASQVLPDWWKKMPTYSGNKFDLNPGPTVTSKKCFPLLDGITSGYVVTLWSDLFVTKDELGYSVVKWTTAEPVAESWTLEQSKGYEIPNGFNSIVFKYLHGWVIETPKNYSCLITHPIGFPNIPIRTLTGVVDTDRLKTHINSPFVIKDDFEGIIPKGTPMFQVIPFKRDNWKMEIDLMSQEENNFNYEKLRSTIVSSYGKFLRTKKEYK